MNKNIEIESTRKDLSALSGLIFFDNLLSRLNLLNRVSIFLPRMKRKMALLPKDKLKVGILGFIAGAECVDDHKDLRNEGVFSNLTKGALSTSGLHLFLSSFKLRHIEKLQNILPVMAYELRRKMFPKSSRIIITMDATPHDQYGKYMEGVDWNYDNRWCYTSQNAFDEKGFCYGWNLLKGSAHSSVGAVEMIERIFQNLKTNENKYFRADSAYGTHKIYNSLIGLGVNFTICLKENVWASILNKVEFQMRWRKINTKFFDSNKCQIGSTIYSPRGLERKQFLRVVFIRTKKKEILPETKRHYRYYAIVTDISSTKMNDEEIINFYRGRANAENFIKDLKYGMDFKHFPCQQMNKNKVWGLMGILAYNLMRFSSFLIDERGCFLKRVRKKMVYLASEIRKGQRKIKLRFSHNIFKEVERLERKMAEKFLQVYYCSGFKT